MINLALICENQFRRSAVTASVRRWLAKSAPAISTFERAVPALAALARENPDLAIADVSLPDLDGLDYIPEIVERRLAAHLAVICDRFDERVLLTLKRLPRDAWIDLRTETMDTVGRVLANVLRGIPYVSASIQSELNARRTSTQAFLSPREELVLSVLGEGLDNEAAGALLRISPETVRTHRAAIMRKLTLRQKAALIRYAEVHGYIRVTPNGVLHPGFDRLLRKI